MLAAVAANEARPRRWRGASSITATVAVPVKSPAENPESTRPAKSSGSPPSKRKQSALAAAHPSPASSTGRRPSTSETPPATVSTAITPAAYTAKITVTISEEKPISSWYSP